MVRVTIEGYGHEKAGKDLKHFFEMGQRKIVRHFKVTPDLIPGEIGACDVAIIEIIKEKEKKDDTSTGS